MMRRRLHLGLLRLALAAAVALAGFLHSTDAAADPLRILVSVGHRVGLAGEAPLKHPLKDAARVRDVFVQVGGVSADAAFLLNEPTASQLYAALDKAAALAKTRRPSEVTLLFYFSGHGDHDTIHLGGERVALKDIDARLAQAPAALRMLVVDACRTADVRGKGVKEDEPFAITADAASANGATGVVRIQASADGEMAQESDELAGAIFTHYWTTGLAGAADADGDGRVTLAEAYAFAYGQTLYRSSRASGVVQRPAAEFDLKEASPVVLTRTGATSAIKVPRATDVRYVVYALGARTVIGELWSSPDRAVALAVAPGKYVVQRRGGGGRAAAVQIDVGKNEQRELAATDFQPVPEEVLARKGGELLLRPNELSLGYVASASRLVGLGHELALGFGHEWDGGFAVSIAASGGLGDHEGNGQSTSLAWIALGGLAEERLRAGALVLRLGLGPRAVTLFQTVTRDDAARLALAGYDGTRHARSFMLGGQALVGARLPLGSRGFVELDARAELFGANIEGTPSAVLGAGVGASFGVAF